MHIQLQTLVLAALSLNSALAQPAHRHEHKHRRALVDVLKRGWQDVDFVKLCKDIDCVNGGKAQQAPEVPVNQKLATTPNKPKESTPEQSDSTPATSDTGDFSNLSSLWSKGDTSRSDMVYMGDGSACKGGCTSADGKPYTDFGAESAEAREGQTDAYQGNVGVPYGHNILPLPKGNIKDHKYTITFQNADKSPIQVALWNKVGDDYKTPGRQQTGMSRNAFFKFPLNPGQKAAFAFQKNSQVAFSQASDRNGQSGLFDCTWGEADFESGNNPNNGWSGYDRSSIPNSKGNTGLLTISADGFDDSSKESNSFVSAKQLNTGGRTDIPAGQDAHLKVKLGG